MNNECQEIQEKILIQLTEADKSLKWLAKKISMPYTQLHYQLHYATKISTDTFSKIQKVLDTELEKNITFLQIMETNLLKLKKALKYKEQK